jgi:hypothetical protein
LGMSDLIKPPDLLGFKRDQVGWRGRSALAHRLLVGASLLAERGTKIL